MDPLEIGLVPSTPAALPLGALHLGAHLGRCPGPSFWVTWVLLQWWLGPQEDILAFLIVSGGHCPPPSLPSGDRPKPLCREGSSDPSSSPLLTSPGPWEAGTEKLPGGHEEAKDHPAVAGPRGEGAVRL